MNEMKIRISLYFEIKDSEMFGGEGSVGYTEQNIGFTVTEEKPYSFRQKYRNYEDEARNCRELASALHTQASGRLWRIYIVDKFQQLCGVVCRRM